MYNVQSIKEVFSTDHDIEGKILEADVDGLQSPHYTREQLVGKKYLDLCHSQDRELVRNHFVEAIKQGTSESRIYRFRIQQNTYVCLQSTSKLICNKSKEKIDYIFSKHNIMRNHEGETIKFALSGSSTTGTVVAPPGFAQQGGQAAGLGLPKAPDGSPVDSFFPTKLVKSSKGTSGDSSNASPNTNVCESNQKHALVHKLQDDVTTVNCALHDAFIISDDESWKENLLSNLKKERPNLKFTGENDWIGGMSKIENLIISTERSKLVVIGIPVNPETDYAEFAANSVFVNILETQTLDDARLILVQLSESAKIPSSFRALTAVKDGKDFMARLLEVVDNCAKMDRPTLLQVNVKNIIWTTLEKKRVSKDQLEEFNEKSSIVIKEYKASVQDNSNDKEFDCYIVSGDDKFEKEVSDKLKRNMKVICRKEILSLNNRNPDISHVDNLLQYIPKTKKIIVGFRGNGVNGYTRFITDAVIEQQCSRDADFGVLIPVMISEDADVPGCVKHFHILKAFKDDFYGQVWKALNEIDVTLKVSCKNPAKHKEIEDLLIEHVKEFRDHQNLLHLEIKEYFLEKRLTFKGMRRGCIRLHLSAHDPGALRRLSDDHERKDIMKKLAKFLLPVVLQEDFHQEWSMNIDKEKYDAALMELESRSGPASEKVCIEALEEGAIEGNLGRVKAIGQERVIKKTDLLKAMVASRGWSTVRQVTDKHPELRASVKDEMNQHQTLKTEWLLRKEQHLQLQVKDLEISKYRKRRNVLSARQISCKRSDCLFPESDVRELETLSQQYGVITKKLKAARKLVRQHSSLMEEHGLKPQQWLLRKEKHLQLQVKDLESEISKYRKRRNVLSARQRSCKRSGRVFPESDVRELETLSQQHGVITKKFKAARKLVRQHSSLMKEYGLKPQKAMSGPRTMMKRPPFQTQENMKGTDDVPKKVEEQRKQESASSQNVMSASTLPTFTLTTLSTDEPAPSPRDKVQHQQWLLRKEQHLQVQVKDLESEISKCRKQRNVLSARQRSCEKSGRVFPESDVRELETLSQQCGVTTEELKAAKKLLSQHSSLMEEYGLKSQQWLLCKEQHLQVQVKDLESEIIKYRQQRNVLTASQRSCKKSGRVFPESDVRELETLSQQYGDSTKKLQAVRKLVRQHSALIEKYGLKRQKALSGPRTMMQSIYLFIIYMGNSMVSFVTFFTTLLSYLGTYMKMNVKQLPILVPSTHHS